MSITITSLRTDAAGTPYTIDTAIEHLLLRKFVFTQKGMLYVRVYGPLATGIMGGSTKAALEL